MYEIFSDDVIFDMQKKTIPRRSTTFKGGCILKSKSNIGIKKKKVLADLSNIIKKANPDSKVTCHDDQKISRKSGFNVNRDSCSENRRNISLMRKEDLALFENILDRKKSISVPSVEVSDGLVDHFPTCNENVSEISTLGLTRNTKIEEDVFFGTHYSQSEDAKELIGMDNCHMDSPATMYGYCPETETCEENCDGWSDSLWDTAEELHNIVGLSESCRNETCSNLEDMELTSLFSEVPYAVKTTIDVPEILFGSDSDSCGEEESQVIPIPHLDW